MLIKSKISSEWILKYYKELENCNVENHGLIIMQNGETVFEEYSYPYSADISHTLFSVTKSQAAHLRFLSKSSSLLYSDTFIYSIIFQ